MLDELYLSKASLTEKEQISGYLRKLPVVAYLEEINFCRPVTFLVGENGTGKSTLIEALASKCVFNPEGGKKNFRFATNETHSELYRYLRSPADTNGSETAFFFGRRVFITRQAILRGWTKYRRLRRRFGNPTGEIPYIVNLTEKALCRWRSTVSAERDYTNWTTRRRRFLLQDRWRCFPESIN